MGGKRLEMLAAAEADKLLMPCTCPRCSISLSNSSWSAQYLGGLGLLPEESGTYIHTLLEVLEALSRVIQLTPSEYPKTWVNASGTIRTFDKINNTLRRLRLPKVNMY